MSCSKYLTKETSLLQLKNDAFISTVRQKDFWSSSHLFFPHEMLGPNLMKSKKMWSVEGRGWWGGAKGHMVKTKLSKSKFFFKIWIGLQINNLLFGLIFRWHPLFLLVSFAFGAFVVAFYNFVSFGKTCLLIYSISSSTYKDCEPCWTYGKH